VAISFLLSSETRRTEYTFHEIFFVTTLITMVTMTSHDGGVTLASKSEIMYPSSLFGQNMYEGGVGGEGGVPGGASVK
jgi:hypothetical protein